MFPMLPFPYATDRYCCVLTLRFVQSATEWPRSPLVHWTCDGVASQNFCIQGRRHWFRRRGPGEVWSLSSTVPASPGASHRANCMRLTVPLDGHADRRCPRPRFCGLPHNIRQRGRSSPPYKNISKFSDRSNSPSYWYHHNNPSFMFEACSHVECEVANSMFMFLRFYTHMVLTRTCGVLTSDVCVFVKKFSI